MLMRVLPLGLVISCLWTCGVHAAGDVPRHETVDRPADIPVPETESQRAEAKEAAAKQEALQALFVHGDYTFIPLPAFSYNRNENYWIGALMPILKANPQGELQDIFAPQYLHNRFVGESVSLNYYGYRSDTAQYSVIASYATKIEREVGLKYKDVGAGGGRYILAGEVSWFKNAFRRFFGLGNQAPERQESNYTSRETVVNLTAGINLTQDLALMLSERYHDVRVEQGVVSSLPQTKQAFQGITGIGGAQILGHKLSIRYDTRDQQLIPSRGTYATGSVEFNQNLQHEEENQWWRVTADGRRLIPHGGDRFVFVGHVLIDAVTGPGVPFYEEPTLGGENTLRAFGQSRFVDETLALVNFEERIRIKEQKMFDYTLDLEVAPFLDIGRVMHRLSTHDLKTPQVNPGIGLRLMARPHVVGRLDLAYGKDGTNVFVGLDYPF